ASLDFSLERIALAEREISGRILVPIGPFLIPIPYTSRFELLLAGEAHFGAKAIARAGYGVSSTLRMGAEYNAAELEAWQPVLSNRFASRAIGPEICIEGGGFAKANLE